MNTSKRTQRPILLAIAAVLALALLVSTAVILAFADETPEVKADAVNVSLDGKVNLNFKFATEQEGVTGYKAKVGTGDPTDVAKSTDKSGRTVITVGLMPYQMAETVTIQHMNGENVVATTTSSVLEYANKVLASDAELHVEAHDAVRAMLNYGAMTQIDADKNTDNLVNEGLYSWGNPASDMKAFSVSGTENVKLNDAFTAGSINLSFTEGDIALVYTFKYEGNNADTLVAKIDGVNDDIKLVPAGEGTYSFKISNISVYSFATLWNVTISDGNTDNDLVSKHSVLEYLSWNLGDEETLSSEKDVCAALYNLYKHTAAKNSLTSCKHNNTGYGVATEIDGVSDIHCNTCDALLKSNVSDTITYIPEKAIAGANTWEPIKAPATYIEEDDLDYIRYTQNTVTDYGVDYVLLREPYEYTAKPGTLGGNDGTLANTQFDIGSAKYFVIRMRKAHDADIAIELGSTTWTHKNVTTANNQGAVLTGVTLKTKGSADWITYVIDLGAYDQTKFGAVEGKRVVDSFKIAGFGNTVGYSADIDFVAFVEDWADVDALTPDTTVQYTMADKTVKTQGADGGCVTHVNENGDEKCDVCGAAMADTGAYVLNGAALVGMTGTKSNATVSVNSDSDYFLNRTNEANVGNHRIINSPADLYQSNIGNALNVGQARYILIKYKVISGDGADYRMIISTTGASSTHPEGGDKNPATDKWNYSGVSALDLSGSAETWQYKLVDAPAALYNNNAVSGQKEPVYKVDPSTGDYIIDTLTIEARDAGAADLVIGYIAFADDMTEVEGVLKADANVANISNMVLVTMTFPGTAGHGLNPGVATTVNVTVVNGEAQHSAGTTTEADGVYTTPCAICGQVLATKDFNVEGVTINKLLTPDWLAAKRQYTGTGSSYSQKVEDGTWYFHYSTTSGLEYGWTREGYGANGWTEGGGTKMFDVGASEYVVIRAKVAEANKTININISSKGYNIEEAKGVNAAGKPNSAGVQADIFSSMTHAFTEADTWVTFKVKLTGLTSWKLDDGETTYVVDSMALRGGSSAGTDIAYIAFVSTEAEADALIAADAAQ